MVRVGDRVRVKSLDAMGQVRFVGALSGKEGSFVGIELDRPVGKNDGELGGKKYFDCASLHGTFVRESNVEKAPSAKRHPAGSAAASHERNEEYMEEFERGFKALALANGSRSATTPDTPEGKGSNREIGAKMFKGAEFGKVFDTVGIPEHSRSWERGPRNPEGLLCDASDRPILCGALSPDQREFVVGGCDHGLKVFDLRSGKEKRNLFSKKFGHREWVTGCTYVPDGSIVSAGMDNKICVWRGAQCSDLEGHRGSISRILATEDGGHCVSCSYDKTIRIWNLRSKREEGCFTGHKAPILDMIFNDGMLISGSRDGISLAWDLSSGVPHRLSEGNHNGHVSSLHSFGTRQFCSGDQAGVIRLWDLRSRGTPVQKANVHPGGAVNAIKTTSEDLLVSAGADKKVVVSDPRRLDTPLMVLEHHKDFIYSLQVTSKYILSGAGDGLLLVHSLDTGKLCYGLGANTAAVRCILAGDDFLVAAGDDGKALSYVF